MTIYVPQRKTSAHRELEWVSRDDTKPDVGPFYLTHGNQTIGAIKKNEKTLSEYWSATIHETAQTQFQQKTLDSRTSAEGWLEDQYLKTRQS